jgi:energy-coupling factor transporter ATP-binding protein EcfA2
MWQRDALRRLAQGGGVDDETVAAYATALVDADESALVPLLADQLTAGHGAAPAVLVLAVGRSQNVNRLPEGQSLTFAASGLTIAYGDNGSGKSGYARVLKAVSRTRAEAQVRNDIFREGNLVPTAEITYRCDGPDITFAWRAGSIGPDDLTRVSFFDRSCVDIYLSKDTDVAFRPFGLDLFDSLVSVCDRVRAVLDERAAAVGRRTDGLATLGDSTAAGAFLTHLSAATTDAEIAAACTFDAQQATRLATVGQALASIAQGTAASDADRLHRLAQRAERLRATLESLAAVVSPEHQNTLVQKRDDAASKDAVARLARGETLKTATLEGVGDDPWRALWETARTYSAFAYPDRPFPVVDEAVCLLCQQPIEDEAAERLKGFEAFVRDTTQVAAETARQALETELHRLDVLVVSDQQTVDLIADLRIDFPETACAIEAYLSEAQEALNTLKLVTRGPGTSKLVNFPVSPSPTLLASIGALQTREAELRTAVSGGDDDAFRSEHAELAARRQLGSAESLVRAERDRLKQVAAIASAKHLTMTNAISEKAADITNDVMTEVLVDRFSRETDRLGLENVVLRTVGGRRGILRYRTGFVGAQQEAPLPEVLSEGEQTALGMAGFLAEVWTDESHSAVIFDDPVTSLDHERRDKVAERLVQLAKERQTIVFTHDVAFVLALKKHAIHNSVNVTERSVERLHERPGHCSEQHKFSAKLVSERVAEMREELARLRAEQSSMTTEQFRDQTGLWYRQLRKTWERAIEEVVVGEILTRGDLQVHPKMVRTLVLFTADDNRELQYGYGRATELSEAHDESAIINSPPPSPEEMASDLDALDMWCKRVGARRNLPEREIYEIAVTPIA